MKKVKVLLAGIGGYGKLITNEILNNYDKLDIELCAVADPFPNGNDRLEEIKALGAKVYSDMEEFFKTGSVDLTVISTPIQFHTKHIITALEHGSNVLCEKPLCADKKDIEKLIAARDKSGKFVYIGYQWSFSKAIEDLKADISAGVFGKPLSLKTLVVWPRNADYFSRGTGWAGKISLPSGELVYDSIANNAAAHYLHNMFYVLGSKVNEALAPKDFTATLLRANNIENFDTADIICKFDGGFEARFTATHTTKETLNPCFDYAFEKGRVLFCNAEKPLDDASGSLEYVQRDIVAYFSDGSVKHYGDPYENERIKFYIALDAVRGLENGYERCGIETAAVHTRFINELQKSTEIKNVKKSLVKTEDKMTYVEGLFGAVTDIYRTGNGSLSDFAE